MSKKILLFDIDGTLLLTGGASRKALACAFRDYFDLKVELPPLHTHGKTDPVIFGEISRDLLGRALLESEYCELRRCYETHFAREILDTPNFSLMPGVPALLQKLASRDDLHIGTETGNFEETAWLKLARGGIRHFFGFGGFASDSPDRAEFVRIAIQRARAFNDAASIPNSRVFVIGDAPQDVLAGKKAGARTISVLTGMSTREELEPLKPDLILENLEAISTFLEFIDRD
jgi:phosphoglycolate phosphatase-like HAD superfamily hydrolase